MDKSLIVICVYIFVFFVILFYLFYNCKTYDKRNIVNLMNFRVSDRANFRVVISMTTIPSRTKFISETIDRLKNQTYSPDAIYVCVPYTSKRLGKPYILPSDLVVPSNVKIIRGIDYGPATKLIGCIPYENNPNTLIITIDDDQYYKPTMIQLLVSYAIKYPDYAIGIHSLTQNLTGTSCEISQGKNILSPDAYYLEGYGGVAYRRKFISREMLEYYENLATNVSACFLSDDLTISTWLEKQGIKRLKLCEGDTRTTVDSIHSQNPLNQEKRNETYKKCLLELV